MHRKVGGKPLSLGLPVLLWPKTEGLGHALAS